MICSSETASDTVREDIRTQPRPHCILCGSQGESLLSGLKDLVFGVPGKWSFTHCPNPDCGLAWLDPMPIPEDIGKIYETYYTHSQTPPVPLSSKRRLIQAVIWGYLRAIMGYRQGIGPAWYGLLWPVAYTHRAGAIASQGMSCYLPAPRGGKNRLLEIGFGSGERLEMLSQLGWQVEGVEPDPVVVENARARGFNARQGELAELGYETDSFDAIVMNHVLEHVHNPIEFLGECRRILRPGGRLVSIQPNVDSMCSRHFGEHWIGWSPPCHLFMYRINSLKQLAVMSGLKVERLFTAATIASDWYRMCESNKLDCDVSQVHVIRGMAFQFAQRVRSWFDPTVAEELVLVAGKSSDS